MSQTALVIRVLRRGEKLTPLDAWKRFGIYRLGARVWDARKAGHQILTQMVEVKPGMRVASYSMRRKAA